MLIVLLVTLLSIPSWASEDPFRLEVFKKSKEEAKNELLLQATHQCAPLHPRQISEISWDASMGWLFASAFYVCEDEILSDRTH